MKIMVTGGAGYIGSHTAMHLSQQGHQVVVLDNLSRGHRWAVKWGELEEVDLLDLEGVTAALKRHRPDAVLHFAAFALVGESVQKPDLYYRNNFVGSLNLLQAMVSAEVKQLVFSSTCAVYGPPVTPLLSEEHQKFPVNPYGHSKLMVEQAIADFSVAYGLRACILRYFNAAGCDPGGQTGEVHNPETHLIPCIFNAIQENRPVKIFGTDYDTPDGTCVRDYIHVLDLAAAHRLALERLSELKHPAFNLGTGRGYSVREVIQSVERVTGQTVQIQEDGRRAGDPPALVAEASLARAELGWIPEWTELDAIVESAWGWHQKGS
jgi:UDP-glucose-4-epimerase GalE